MINSTRTSESTQTLPTPKKRTRRPAKLSLNLEFPDNQGVFYFYKEQDEDEGSVYYPASLFYKLYKKREKLGEGAAGIVRRYEKRSTKASVAVKVTRTRDDEIFSQIKEEFKKMRQLKHRGVVRYEEMYYDELRGKVFCVMELFEGREMKQVIEHRGPFSEDTGRRLFKKMLDAVLYLHGQGVVHRDIKPSNILLSDDGERVKLIDFNVARFPGGDEPEVKYCCKKWDNYKMRAITGTMSTSAPELLKADSHYTEACDAWSLGITLYQMLTGLKPFYEEYKDDLMESIISKDFNKDNSEYQALSSEAKDLLEKLLTKDPSKRFKIYDALTHPWIAPKCTNLDFLKRTIHENNCSISFSKPPSGHEGCTHNPDHLNHLAQQKRERLLELELYAAKMASKGSETKTLYKAKKRHSLRFLNLDLEPLVFKKRNTFGECSTSTSEVGDSPLMLPDY